MIRAVLDTNTLASGAVAPGGTLAAIIDAWRNGAFEVVISTEILVELEHTLQKPYFRRRLTAEQVGRFLILLQRRATLAPITIRVRGVATHMEDDLVLATAVSAKTPYLVTGDTKLQRLGSYQAVTIVSPRQFLEILNQQTSSAEEQ